MQFLIKIQLPSWEEIFRGLMALLCQVIYPIISWLYDLFIYVSKVNILSSDAVAPIYKRITIILTIVMVFYVTFEFVKYVVQPDNITDKEKGAGNIIYKMIAVVVLIAFVPTVFDGALKLQNAIVEKNVIGKVIIGNKGEINSNFGGNFSSSIFKMFYNVNDEYADEECDGIPCAALVGMNYKTLREEGSLKYLTTGLNASTETDIEVNGKPKQVTTPFINFDGLFAVVVGAFIAYILVLYCIDVGTRWAQLIYLQIIAPIPIIGFLSPKKDGIFQKWCKQCITTYLDLFLRIAIIYFVLLISGILLDGTQNADLFSNLVGISPWMKSFVIIVLIMGLLLFAQKAPKLLQELFPSTGAASGNFGLKAGARVAPMAARTLGAAFGASRFVGGALGRGIKAGARNIKNGQSVFTKRGREAIKEQRESKQKARDEYRTARKEARVAQRNYNRTTSKDKNGNINATGVKAKEDYAKKQQELDAKRNAYSDAKNKSYRSIVGNALIGGVQGAFTGAKEGAKATKLEDISKQVKAGYKKDKDQINSHEKYLDNGGAGGISGAIDRGITKVATSIGAPTRADQIEQSIKRYDDQIKEQKQYSAVESSVGKSLDSATDANQTKIESGKHKGIVESLGSKGVSTLAEKLGYNEGDVAGKSLTELSRKLAATAENKKVIADELGKRALEKPTDTALQVRAQQARAEAVEAEQQKTKGNKAIAEYENTRILQIMANGGDLLDPKHNFEAGAVSEVQASIQRLKDAYAQPSTRDEVKEILSKTKTESERDRLMRFFEFPDTIDENDVLDALSKTLKTVSSQRTNRVQETENAKNRLQTGEYLAEVKSNLEYNNNNNSNK